MLRASQPDRAWRTGSWPPAALLIPLISSFSTCPDWTRVPCGCVSLLPHRQVSSFESLLHGPMDVFPTSMLCFPNTRIWELRASSKCGILFRAAVQRPQLPFPLTWACLCILGHVTFPLSPMPLTCSPLTLPRKSKMVTKIFWYAKNLEGSLTDHPGLVP